MQVQENSPCFGIVLKLYDASSESNVLVRAFFGIIFLGVGLLSGNFIGAMQTVRGYQEAYDIICHPADISDSSVGCMSDQPILCEAHRSRLLSQRRDEIAH